MSRKSVPTSAGDAGVYCLVLRLRRARWLTVGRLGRRRFAPGWYVYTGSAKRNLAARLHRHVLAEKRFRWHIDFLRTVVDVEEIWVWRWAKGVECRVNDRVQVSRGAGIPWCGFGSSDCRCRSHLTFFHERPRRPDTGVRITVVRMAKPCAPQTNRHLTGGSNGRILSPALWNGATKESP